MSLSPPVLFMIVCVLWGATWIALKADLRQLPPVLLAGTRFGTAGLALVLAVRLRGGSIGIARRDLARFGIVTLFMIALPYPLLFWGTEFVSSGLSAVLDLALMPIALLTIGAIVAREPIVLTQATGVAVGVAGLVVLFAPAILAPGTGKSGQVLGGAAIVASAFVYAFGSVLARQLLRRYSPLLLSGTTMLYGGGSLLLLSLLLEPGATNALLSPWTATTWLGWIFLVLCGSLIAYTAFLELVRRWGPTSAGAYAFVSPMIAVLLGMLAFGETIGPQGAAGMAMMLAGAWLTVRGGRSRKTQAGVSHGPQPSPP